MQHMLPVSIRSKRKFPKFPSAKKYHCCIHKHVKGCMMLYQSSDIDRNKFCIHVKRFIPKNTDRFLYNPTCNNFQFFASLHHVAEEGSAAKCKSLIRPRRLLSPTRACNAPIVNSFTCVCDIQHFSEHIVPKTTFSVSWPRWLEWRQIRRRPLQRSNSCWYLMMFSSCLNWNCHWYPKCNLEAVNFHWECVEMIFVGPLSRVRPKNGNLIMLGLVLVPTLGLSSKVSCNTAAGPQGTL